MEGTDCGDNDRQNRRLSINYEYCLISGFSVCFVGLTRINSVFFIFTELLRINVKIWNSENPFAGSEKIERKERIGASVIISSAAEISCSWVITDYPKTSKNIFTIFDKNRGISFYIEICLHSINQHQNYVNQKEKPDDELD